MFILTTKNGNYSLRQAPGSTIELDYDRATSPDEPIVFLVNEFALTPKGVDLVAKVTKKPARLNGLETQFQFDSGVLQIREGNLKGFTITGHGPLPKALVGDASADIALQFAQVPDPNSGKAGAVRLIRASASIAGSNLLQCRASRFDFSLDGLGLEFVEDGGAFHLYFTLSGRAKYSPIQGDDSSGPLAWLPKVEIQLVNCPLTGNMRVIVKHVKFLIELPRPIKFDLMGCFGMEIRGIGFLPQFDKLGDDTSAMQIAGQIFFAEGSGDVIETKIDFHNLYVALPAPGSNMPRLFCKGLGLTIKQGEAFELSGEVDFFTKEYVEPGILGDGFMGSGMVQIQGLPRITATFSFLRVSADNRVWKRAWFLYLEAQEMSIQIPVVEMFIREVGLGFGYRYTLASIRMADQINDTSKLLKELKRLAVTQNNLSDRNQWRVDLENPGDSPRWTLAARAMISQTSPQKGPFGDYERSPDGSVDALQAKQLERQIPSLFLLDVVLALRSDMTFFMAGRAWMNTNYADFHDVIKDPGDPLHFPNPDLKNHPMFDGFVLLSPRQKRLLANLSSNQDAMFGDHPPVPALVKKAIKDVKVTATLLVEPGLFHCELGWPNQLQWNENLGPLQVEYRGGAIFRVSTTEQVLGLSFLARGTLQIGASFDAGFIGASLTAIAQIAFGARYIGVLAFRPTVEDSLQASAIYAAIGVEIKVEVDIEFYLQFKVFRRKFKKHFGVSIDVNFTAAVELAILPSLNPADEIPDLRGSATICVSLMGHGVQFDVSFASSPNAGDRINRAIDVTNRFLQLGLEAEDVGPVPGTNGTLGALSAPAPAPPPSPAPAGGLGLVAPAPVAPVAPGGPVPPAGPSPGPGSPAAPVLPAPDFSRKAALDRKIQPPPGYSLVSVKAPKFQVPGKIRQYYLLVPKAPEPFKPGGFFAVPPKAGVKPNHDMTWDFPAPDGSVVFEHFNGSTPTPAAGPLSWAVDWDAKLDCETRGDDWSNDNIIIREFLSYAYLTDSPPAGTAPTPLADPEPLVPFDHSMEDGRVQNPAESSFEAAVRGAKSQLTTPFFKFDEKSEYDSTLKTACATDTTIYAPGGSNSGANQQDIENSRTANQLRGKVMHDMLRDIQSYAVLDDGGAETSDMKELRGQSLAFRLGLVFRATGVDDKIHWLETNAGKISQRIKIDALDPDSAQVPVEQFNKRSDGFLANPPTFLRVRKCEHASMIAVAWDLARNASDSATDLDHHLSHYLVRRVHLNGVEPEVQFAQEGCGVTPRQEKRKRHSSRATFSID